MNRAGEQERDVVGNDKVAAAMVGGAVENQQDILPGEPARQTSRKAWKHAVFEVGMIR